MVQFHDDTGALAENIGSLAVWMIKPNGSWVDVTSDTTNGVEGTGIVSLILDMSDTADWPAGHYQVFYTGLINDIIVTSGLHAYHHAALVSNGLPGDNTDMTSEWDNITSGAETNDIAIFGNNFDHTVDDGWCGSGLLSTPFALRGDGGTGGMAAYALIENNPMGGLSSASATYEAWCSLDADNDAIRTILNENRGANGNWVWLGVTAAGEPKMTANWTTLGGTQSLESTGYPINDGRIHHLVGSIAVDGFRIYLDGDLIAGPQSIGTVSGAVTDALCLMAHKRVSYDQNWKGRLAVARFYNRPLTDSEVKQNFESGLLSIWGKPVGSLREFILSENSLDDIAMFLDSYDVNYLRLIEEDGTIKIVKGDDYLEKDGREIRFTNTGGGWPSLSGATIHFITKSLGPIDCTFDTPDIVLELTSSDTNDIKTGRYSVRAIIDGSTITLCSGTINVEVLPC
jgi:hypothetical protein